jgi:hypothetical protein
MKEDKVTPELEVVNTPSESKWRLRMGEEEGHWTTHYRGIYAHTFNNGETWYVVIDYWNGTLRTERPFQITYADDMA